MFWLRFALVLLAIWLVYADLLLHSDEDMDPQEQMEMDMIQERKEVCLIAHTSYGNCKGKRKMWYYNAMQNKCKTFIYSNCGGNQNRFYTRKECMEYCGNYNLKRFLVN